MRFVLVACMWCVGLVFVLGGCAVNSDKGEWLENHKEGCERDLEAIPGSLNRCVLVAGAYREQRDKEIYLGDHFGGIVHVNTSYDVKPSKKMVEKYLKKALEVSKKQLAMDDRSVCNVSIQDGAIIDILRDDIHKSYLRCKPLSDSYSSNAWFFYDTPQVRAKLYEYADFTPKQIEEALRKDYPLWAELSRKFCGLELRGADSKRVKKICEDTEKLYKEGAMYNGVQVFAPNIQALNEFKRLVKEREDKAKREEIEQEKWWEREKAKELEEQRQEKRWRENFMAPIAKDCASKFTNKEICHIVKHKLLELNLSREGADYDANKIFAELKAYTRKLSPKKLKAMEAELASKKGLKYKGESYCRWGEAFVWYGLRMHEETSDSLKKKWARVCNLHFDVVLESPFFD